jgi:glucan 1,3-beta-glucosidase
LFIILGIGSIEVVDGVFNGVRLGIQTMWSLNINPVSVATIIIDNVDFTNCDVAIQSTTGTNLLNGGSVVTTYVQGNQYSSTSEINGDGKATRTRTSGVYFNYVYFSKIIF